MKLFVRCLYGTPQNVNLKKKAYILWYPMQMKLRLRGHIAKHFMPLHFVQIKLLNFKCVKSNFKLMKLNYNYGLYSFAGYDFRAYEKFEFSCCPLKFCEWGGET